MEIRNEYTSLNSRQYHDHTHHITKCLHEEKSGVKTGAAGAGGGAGTVQEKSVEFSRDGDSYFMGTQAAQRSQSGKAKSLLRGFWDALGEEGETEGKGLNMLTAFRQNLLSGIYGAAASIRQTVSTRISEGIKSIREKLRVGAEGGRRYSGTGREDFTALTDGRTSSRQDRQNRRRVQRSEELRREGTSVRKQEEIPMKILVNSHLTDSYSKNGEYCQLGENLTYSKGGVRAKAKESAGRE